MNRPDHVASDVRLIVHRRTYPVAGSTSQHLRSAIALLAPRRGGAAHTAYTTWTARWRYSPCEGAYGWTAAAPWVDVDVLCTLPCWHPPRSADGDLIARWISLTAALEIHEQGHVDLAAAAGRAILAALATLAAFPSAAALHVAASAAAEATLDAFRKQEALYDAATGHGATQGVRLP